MEILNEKYKSEINSKKQELKDLRKLYKKIERRSFWEALIFSTTNSNYEKQKEILSYELINQEINLSQLKEMPYNEWAKDFSNKELTNTRKEVSERLKELEKISPVISKKPNKIIGFRNEYRKRLNALENEKSLRA